MTNNAQVSVLRPVRSMSVRPSRLPTKDQGGFPIRLGVLIIGSLYWDRSRVRSRWRLNRLSCTGERKVRVPIRYGKKAITRDNTFTMVFAMSCSNGAQLGTAVVVPTRGECCEPEHLLEEAEHLWAAERDPDEISGICAKWGKVCILENPKRKTSERILRAWHSRIETLGHAYTALPTADGEAPVLDPILGRALIDWPTDRATEQALVDFDLLLMTANEPTLNDRRQYPTAREVAAAWSADDRDHVHYFHNNRHYGITTFQDAEILLALRVLPSRALEPKLWQRRKK